MRASLLPSPNICQPAEHAKLTLKKTIQEAEYVYSGRPTEGRFRNRHIAKDGRYHWLEWKSQPTEGGVLFCIVRDVTDQVELEQALRLYQCALESTSNGVLITNPHAKDSPITYVNPAFERMTGYTAKELIGNSCRLLQGTDREQPEIEQMRVSVREERACHVVLRNH